MVSAVIFDFYGTLARFADTGAADYAAVFAALGHTPDPDLVDGYHTRYNGVEHAEHSVSEETYEAWVRSRLCELAVACGVPEPELAVLVEALRATDQGRLVAYPEAVSTVSSLRAAGFSVGVCSNWGWQLDPCLEEVGLLELVDAGVTSAQAGARKPHPGIYASTLAALGVDAADAVFVGDSWEPDVRGPRRLGMTAVHVWRAEERPGQSPPPLQPGDHRVGDLIGVLDLLGLPRSRGASGA